MPSALATLAGLSAAAVFLAAAAWLRERRRIRNTRRNLRRLSGDPDRAAGPAKPRVAAVEAGGVAAALEDCPTRWRPFGAAEEVEHFCIRLAGHAGVHIDEAGGGFLKLHSTTAAAKVRPVANSDLQPPCGAPGSNHASPLSGDPDRAAGPAKPRVAAVEAGGGVAALEDCPTTWRPFGAEEVEHFCLRLAGHAGDHIDEAGYRFAGLPIAPVATAGPRLDPAKVRPVANSDLQPPCGAPGSTPTTAGLHCNRPGGHEGEHAAVVGSSPLWPSPGQPSSWPAGPAYYHEAGRP